MEQMFFDGWSPVIRTLVIGVLSYVSLVVLLRITGRRTLSKMNAFDLIVTVALGSTLAAVLLDKDVSLVQGVLGMALLVGMQYLVTWSSVRTAWVRRLVTGEPALLLHRGQLLPDAMRRARVTEDELRSAIRGEGIRWLDDLEAVVLETDGSFSVIRQREGQGKSSLTGVSPPGGSALDTSTDTDESRQRSHPHH